MSTRLLGLREQIFVQTVEITRQAQPSRPNIVKYFQNLLQNQLADGIDHWYVASGTPEIPRGGRKTLRNQPNQVQDPIQDQDCLNNDLRLTLTFFIWRQTQENANSYDFVDSFKYFCPFIFNDDLS